MIQDAISLLKSHGIEVRKGKPAGFHVSGIVGLNLEKSDTSSLDPEILQSLDWPNLPCLKTINWLNLGNPSVEFIYPLIDFNETKEKIEENLGLILDLNNSIYFNGEEVGRWTWSRKLIDLEKNDIIEIAKRVKEWFKVSDDDEQGMSAIGTVLESFNDHISFIKGLGIRIEVINDPFLNNKNEPYSVWYPFYLVRVPTTYDASLNVHYFPLVSEFEKFISGPNGGMRLTWNGSDSVWFAFLTPEDRYSCIKKWAEGGEMVEWADDDPKNPKLVTKEGEDALFLNKTEDLIISKNNVIRFADILASKMSHGDVQGVKAIGDIMESSNIQRDLDLLRFIGITIGNSKIVDGTFTISGGLFCLEIDDPDYIKLENRERFARKYLVLERVHSGKLYLVYPTKWYDEVKRYLSSKNIHFFSLNSVYDTGEKIGKVIRTWQSIGVKQSEILGMAKRIRKNLGVSGDDEQGMISTSLLLESNRVPSFSKWKDINEDTGGPVSFLRGLGLKVDVKDYLGWESDYKVYYDFPVLYIKNIELKENNRYSIQKKWVADFAEICNKPKWISKDDGIGEEWKKFIYVSHEDMKSDLERWVKLSSMVKEWGRFQTGEPVVRDYVTNNVIIKIERENPGKFQKNGIAKLAERLSSGMADDEKSGVTNAGDLLENSVPTFNQWKKRNS